MKVILEFENSEGIPVEFEAIPDVGETLQWDGNEYAEAGTYTVGARSYAFNQLTQSVCPVLRLVKELSVDEWINGVS